MGLEEVRKRGPCEWTECALVGFWQLPANGIDRRPLKSDWPHTEADEFYEADCHRQQQLWIH